MRIDPEANVADMLDSWVNGNRMDVIDALANDHPGLTAMFLVVGIGERSLDRGDANTIANILIDRRVELARQQLEPE